MAKYIVEDNTFSFNKGKDSPFLKKDKPKKVVHSKKNISLRLAKTDIKW